jgi:hypothetical protein
MKWGKEDTETRFHEATKKFYETPLQAVTCILEVPG